MNKRTKSLVIGFAVLCLAYPGFAWLIGLRVEASIMHREQRAMDQLPGTITVLNRQYHRGVYGATEELTYGFGPSALRSLGPLAAAADVATWRVTVRNTIHHGPVPQFRTIALATMSTQVELPAQLSAKLRTLLGGEPAFEVHTRLGWFGGTTTTFTSPSYQGRLANGAELTWHAVEASASANADLSSSSLAATVAGAQLKSAKVQAELTGLHVDAKWKRAFDVLYTGPFTMKIDTVKWQSLPASGQSLIQGLSIGATGTADGDYYTSALQFGADAVQVPGYSITHADYAIAFEHLYGPTLAAMTKDMRRNGASAGAATPPSPAAVLEPLKNNAIDLLVHEPVVNISHIGFTMPEGEFRLSARASAPGLKREELDGPGIQAALVQHLNVVADVHIDTALLNRLLASSGRKDAQAGQIDALEKQGYIKRDGAALTAHLTFSAGKIAVNGKPYPPGSGP